MSRRSQLTTAKINQAYDTLVLLERNIDKADRDLIKQVRQLIAQHKLFTPLDNNDQP